MTHAIPGNDDAVRSIRLIAGRMANAVLEGHAQREAMLLAQQEAEAEAEREALALEEQDEEERELTLDEQIQRDMEFLVQDAPITEADFLAAAPVPAEQEPAADPPISGG